MSDAPRRARRPDSRQMWDESDRRQHPSDRDRDRERDRPRDPRPREHDDRDARPRRDRRSYRSRSPDRRSDRDGARGRDRRDERRRPRDERRRDEEERPDSRGMPIVTSAWHGMGEPRTDAPADKPRREDRRDDRRDEDPRPDFSRGIPLTAYPWSKSLPQDEPADSPQDKHRRRSASPRRSPARDDDNGDAYLDTLPTRTKPDSRKSMSVRVGRADSPRQSAEPGRESPSRGRSPSRDMEVDEGKVEDDDDVVVEEDDGGMADMQAMMGFGGFGTTKGQKVSGNNAYAVHKEKKTVYRQYMNRTKGFNRPLSPPR